MICVKLEVYVTVDNLADAKEIADDIHAIINGSGITNSVSVTDDISE